MPQEESDHMPKVSVILTSYNRPHLVQQAIQSVLDQTMTDWELLVMDDGSNQETIDAINSMSFPQDKVRAFGHNVMPGERTGLLWRYAMRINEGVRNSSGEYISPLCDDDYYFPERLARLSHALDSTPQAIAVYGRSYTRQFGSDIPDDPERARRTDMPPDRKMIFNRNPPDQAYWWPGDLRAWERTDSLARNWTPDHNQVMYRRSAKLSWPEFPYCTANGEEVGCADRGFYMQLKECGAFWGVDVWAVCKRYHGRGGQYRFFEPRE
jgi:glycosyltransferase involved in cell wall biosynthesis